MQSWVFSLRVYSPRCLLLWKELFQVWKGISKNWFLFAGLEGTNQAYKNSRFAHTEETFLFTTSYSCMDDAEATEECFFCRI